MIRRPSACSCRTASGVDSLIGSDTASRPANLPSTATNITVWPSSLQRLALVERGELVEPLRSFQQATVCRPRHCLSVDRPGDAAAGHRVEIVDGTQFAISRSWQLRRSRAPADARCAVPRCAASRSRSFLEAGLGRDRLRSARASLGQRAGLVDDDRIDLLQRLQHFGILDQHAFLRSAATPTMIDIGVASPRAQGQAMISTATALTKAQASRGSWASNGPDHERDDRRQHHARARSSRRPRRRPAGSAPGSAAPRRPC